MRESRRRYIHLSSSNDACLRTLFRWKTHRLRQRKVRCNQAVPCATCRKRGHEHLCRYGKLEGTEGQAWRLVRHIGVRSALLTPSAHVGRGRVLSSGSWCMHRVSPHPATQLRYRTAEERTPVPPVVTPSSPCPFFRQSLPSTMWLMELMILADQHRPQSRRCRQTSE